jgi:hypothetical protein
MLMWQLLSLGLSEGGASGSGDGQWSDVLRSDCSWWSDSESVHRPLHRPFSLTNRGG